MRNAIRNAAASFGLASLVGLATPAHSQGLPPELPNRPTKEQLANDNKLFLALAKKALKWEEPAEPVQDRRPDLFRRHQGARRVPDHDVRRPHPDEHRHALVRADDRRLDPQARLQAGRHQADDQRPRPHRSRRRVCLLQAAVRRAARGHEGRRRGDGERRSRATSSTPDDFVYPGVKVDRVLRDGDTIRMGDVLLTAYHTPGHTRGATTWVAQPRRRRQAYVVVFPDGAGFNPGYRLAKNPILSRHRRRLSPHASLARNAEARHLAGAAQRVLRPRRQARAGRDRRRRRRGSIRRATDASSPARSARSRTRSIAELGVPKAPASEDRRPMQLRRVPDARPHRRPLSRRRPTRSRRPSTCTTSFAPRPICYFAQDGDRRRRVRQAASPPRRWRRSTSRTSSA